MSLLLVLLIALARPYQVSSFSADFHGLAQGQRALQSSYTKLPLSWNWYAPPGEKVSLLLSGWAPPNMFKVAAKCKPQNGRKVHLLYLSDSLEYRTIGDFCSQAMPGQHYLDQFNWRDPQVGTILNRTHEGREHHTLHTSNCSEMLQIGHRYIFGVSPVGQYHVYADTNDPSLTSTNRTVQTIATYKQVFGLHPDIIVLASNFWDLARLYDRQQDFFKQYLLRELPKPYVEEYSANLTNLVRLMKSQVSQDVILAIRTHPMPLLHANGTTVAPFLGCHTWVSQLNAVIRMVAVEQGLELIDEGHMVSLLWPNAYAGDSVHPNGLVLQETLNAVLNVVAYRKPELFQDVVCPVT